MANKVILYLRPNGKYELEINSLVCKDDFTNTDFTGVMTEVNTFLLGDGTGFLDGSFDSESAEISWVVLDPSPTEFDGSNNYKITFIDQKA